MNEKYEADRRVMENFERGERKKKRRVFLWVFLAIQVVFLVMVIAGAASNEPPSRPPGYTDAQYEQLDDAGKAGTTIGVAFIVLMWAATDIIVGGTYAIYRLVKRGK